MPVAGLQRVSETLAMEFRCCKRKVEMIREEIEGYKLERVCHKLGAVIGFAKVRELEGYWRTMNGCPT